MSFSRANSVFSHFDKFSNFDKPGMVFLLADGVGVAAWAHDACCLETAIQVLKASAWLELWTVGLDRDVTQKARISPYGSDSNGLGVLCLASPCPQ